MADILALQENHDASVALLKTCVILRRKHAKGSRRKILIVETGLVWVPLVIAPELFKVFIVLINALFLGKDIHSLFIGLWYDSSIR